MRTGTNHFANKGAAIAYYLRHGYSTEAVSAKLAAGEIKIGQPFLRPGETCKLDEDQRYFVYETEPEAVRLSNKVELILPTGCLDGYDCTIICRGIAGCYDSSRDTNLLFDALLGIKGMEAGCYLYECESLEGRGSATDLKSQVEHFLSIYRPVRQLDIRVDRLTVTVSGRTSTDVWFERSMEAADYGSQSRLDTAKTLIDLVRRDIYEEERKTP